MIYRAAIWRTNDVPCHSRLLSINLITLRRKGCCSERTGAFFFGSLPRASATINSPLVIFIFSHSFQFVSCDFLIVCRFTRMSFLPLLFSGVVSLVSSQNHIPFRRSFSCIEKCSSQRFFALKQHKKPPARQPSFLSAILPVASHICIMQVWFN